MTFSAVASAQLKVELILLTGDKVIKCEPIKLKMVWENQSEEEVRVGFPPRPYYSKVTYLMVNGNKIYLPKVLSGSQAVFARDVLEPGERSEDNLELMNILKESGEYRIRLVADFDILGENYLKGKFESEEVRVTVSEPEGVDLTVYNEALARLPLTAEKKLESDRENVCLEIEIMRDTLLARYPTSTYAGWVLVQQGSSRMGMDYQNGLVNRSERLSGFIRESLLENDRTVNSMKTYGGKRIKALSDYLTAKPDFALFEWMEYEMAFWHIYRGEYKEAANKIQRIFRSSKDLRLKEAILSTIETLKVQNLYLSTEETPVP